MREKKASWTPCKCPVCPDTVLGFKEKKDLVHYYCEDCHWTFRFDRQGKVLSRHKGRMLWDDYPPYIKD